MEQLSPERRLQYLAHIEPLALDYTPSHAVWRQTKSIDTTVISAPSGAGKTAVIKAVTQNTNAHNVTSKTTRPQRPGELPGQEYSHFFNIHSPSERWQLLHSLTAGEFVQVEPYEATHDLYGSCPDDYRPVSILNATSRTYERLMSQGLFRTMRQICLVNPSVERLVAQLDGRGAMDAAQRTSRLHDAAPSLAACLKNKGAIFIINDTVDEAAAQVAHVIEGKLLPSRTLAAGREAAATLLRDITTYDFSGQQQSAYA